MNANRRNKRSGFTIIEVLIAVVVLCVGFLAMMSSTALNVRAMARARIADAAAISASNRLEQLRLTACSNQAAGADTLQRNGTNVWINAWTLTSSTNSTWRIRLTKTYVTAPGRTRRDVLETEVSCLL